jgi:hypothetical protein
MPKIIFLDGTSKIVDSDWLFDISDDGIDNSELVKLGKVVYVKDDKIEKSDTKIASAEISQLLAYEMLTDGQKDSIKKGFKVLKIKSVGKESSWYLVDCAEKSKNEINISLAGTSNGAIGTKITKRNIVDRNIKKQQIKEYMKEYLQTFFYDYADEIKKLNTEISDEEIADEISWYLNR